jgi:hypothetical protein
MTTTYPAPSGIYNQIVTTGGGGRDTILARDAGKVLLAPPSNAAGAVGIGTTDTSGGKLVVNGNTRVSGDATITGTTSVQDLVIAGRAFPPPPAGTTRYVWADVRLSGGTDADTSVPQGAAYTGNPRADTCNGDASGAYTCPNGVSKTCVDVQRVGTNGSDSDSNTSYTVCAPNCPDDTCNGDKDGGWSCPSTYSGGCRDIKKMGGIRHRSDWTCNVATPIYRDFVVVCNTPSNSTVKALVAQ